MAEQLEVDQMSSKELLKDWDKQKAKRMKNGAVVPTFGDTGVSKEDLAKMVEGLKLTEAEAPDTPPPLAQEKEKEKEKEKGRGTARGRAPLRARDIEQRAEEREAQIKKEAEKYDKASEEEERLQEKCDEKRVKEKEAGYKRVDAGKQSSVQGDIALAKPPRARVHAQIKLPSKERAKPEQKKSEEKPTTQEKSTPEKSTREEKKESPSAQPAEASTASPPISPSFQSSEDIIQAYKKARSKTASKARKAQQKFASQASVLGEGDKMGEGDTYLVKNLLPEELAGNIFESLKKEVSWRSMFHRGGEVPRLVAVQGTVDEDGRLEALRSLYVDQG
jgi:hypothetical protein